MGRLHRFRMWLACKIIGKRTAFYYNGNFLVDGGVYIRDGQWTFMQNWLHGNREYIELRRGQQEGGRQAPPPQTCR